MKLATQVKTVTDIMQHCTDPMFAYKTVEISSGTPIELNAGDAINPATGQLTKSTDSDTAVVIEYTPVGSKAVVVFDKLVILSKTQIKGFDSAGTLKAQELLAANPFIKLI